jgi:hypothetical protein
MMVVKPIGELGCKPNVVLPGAIRVPDIYGCDIESGRSMPLQLGKELSPIAAERQTNMIIPSDQLSWPPKDIASFPLDWLIVIADLL